MPAGTPAWVVTGYDDVRALCTDLRLVQIEPRHLPPGSDALAGLLPPDLDAVLNTHLLHLNPPDHTRLRRLVSAAFTARWIEQLAPCVQQITDELLDGLDAAGEVDLITAFADPPPITVICQLLGVPTDRRADFRGLVDDHRGRLAG